MPTSNRIDALKQCLDSLDQQTKKDFTVILVGLEQNPNVEQLVKSYANLSIVYILQKEKGLIGAANEALKIATNEIFVRTDDDVILDKDWYENLISTFEADEAIGGVTGPTTMSEAGLNSRDLTKYLENFRKSKNLTGKLLYWFYNSFLYENKLMEVSRFLDSGVFTIGSNYPLARTINAKIEVSNLEACNWSAKRELLLKINGFDTVFLKGLGEYHEADAALKIKNLGYKLIFNPKVAVRHNVEIGKVSAVRPNSYYRIQNFIIFYFRYNKINSLLKMLRFLGNVCLQDGYYIITSIKNKNIAPLGAIPGTFMGLVRVLIKYEN